MVTRIATLVSLRARLSVLFIRLLSCRDRIGRRVVGDEVRFAPPGWARRLAEAGHGLLFLDELSTAPPAVQYLAFRKIDSEGVRLVAPTGAPAGVACSE